MIEIPKKYRVIAIRVNKGNLGPARPLYSWPLSGLASVNTEIGLFAVEVSQYSVLIEYFKRWKISNEQIQYLILEVDIRKIRSCRDIPKFPFGLFEKYRIKKMKSTINHSTEIEFSECNVLFNGSFPEFMIKLQGYTTAKEYDNVLENILLDKNIMKMPG
ncbi:MAG: hypothetical protein M1445_09675 [Bacteroidetes bacterium]|nr:hypothetical protein [Bacteroidota bacterium]